MALWSYVIKPYILYKDIDYTIKEMAICILCTFKVGFLSCMIAIPARLFLDNSIIESIILFFITIAAVIISSYIFMYNEDRKKIFNYLYYITKKKI